MTLRAAQGCVAIIRGRLRDYSWGVRDGMADLTGAPTGGPEAELWFGAHPSAPSPVTWPSPDLMLDDALDPSDVPLLTKVLAAARPLSLQVHPTAELARRWRNDPESADLLADDNPKAEMLVALEDFLVLVGWRGRESAGALLGAVGAGADVIAAIEAGDRATAVRLLFGSARVRATPQQWGAAVDRIGEDSPTREALVAAAAAFGDDPGVAVAALLQSEQLVVGDAVNVPPGVPHAYVRGRGIEVMNSSDNVLRMGLTPKRVSLDHALAAILPDAHAQVIRAPSDGRYEPQGTPFAVRHIHEGTLAAPQGHYRLALPLQGRAVVTSGEERRVVPPIHAWVSTRACPDATVHFDGPGLLVTATQD